MLLSLSIRDIVLIDKLDLDWHGNLCTLTGETGAGKSILLDALGLAIGARGDAGPGPRGGVLAAVSSPCVGGCVSGQLVCCRLRVLQV